VQHPERLRDAVRLPHLPTRVAEQHVVQPLLPGEALVRGLVIGADADHRRARAREVLVRVAEGANLPGANRRYDARGEEEHHRTLRPERIERPGLSGGVLEVEARCRLTFLDHWPRPMRETLRRCGRLDPRCPGALVERGIRWWWNVRPPSS